MKILTNKIIEEVDKTVSNQPILHSLVSKIANFLLISSTAQANCSPPAGFSLCATESHYNGESVCIAGYRYCAYDVWKRYTSGGACGSYCCKYESFQAAHGTCNFGCPAPTSPFCL